VIARVRLPLRFDADALAADVEALPAQDWMPHFNTSYYEGDWSGVALRSSGGAPLALYPDPSADADWQDTETLTQCPALAAALAAFQCELQSARLLALGAGAAIREHRDYRLGYDDGEVRIHIPVTTSGDVEFVHDGEPVAMAPGEAWYLDLNLKHSVANRGEQRRVHLVVDCVVNPWLTDLLRAGTERQA
jgi:hypothetical protein